MILRQVKKSTDYDNIAPAIQININGYDLFKKGEFIYKSEMTEVRFNERRDNMLTIYDINLDYLRNIDYNKIKKGTIYDLEKILYIFVCDNKKLLDYIYSGDIIMNKVRDDFDVITYETDSILYYNPEDLYDAETKEKIRQACEEGRQEGRQEGRNEAIKENAKKMIQEEIPLETISKITGLSLKEIENL